MGCPAIKLSDFIRIHMGEILQVWDYDARTILPNPDLSREKLRDHVEQILLGIVVELERPPTRCAGRWRSSQPGAISDSSSMSMHQ